MKSEFVLVAQLGRSVGIKGFVKLHHLSDFPEQFKRGASFFDEKGQIYTIKSCKADSVLFENYESLELAKNLVNLKLYQSIEQSRKSCKLKKDEFFYFDIIGLKVFENGVFIGVVKDILQTSAQHLLLIACDEKLIAQGRAKEFYLPYASFYVSSVDLPNSQIHAQNALTLLESL